MKVSQEGVKIQKITKICKIVDLPP
jgi:hypothetical protein